MDMDIGIDRFDRVNMNGCITAATREIRLD
jgi:hypothetical protein